MSDEQTANPESGAVEAPSVDDKLASILGLETDEQSADEAPAQAASDDDDELPIEEPVAQDDAEELTHNGQKVRLSKEEIRELAQKGFDYTQKTQAVAEQVRQVQDLHKALQAQAQVKPQVVEALANVRLYERALQGFANVDWVGEATSDPIGYQEKKARYDVLREQYGQAIQQFEYTRGEAQKVDHEALRRHAQIEQAKVFEAVPEWRDEKRRTQDQTDIIKSLRGGGITDDEIASLADSRLLLIARKAMLYDRALEARKARQNTLSKAAPVATPGAPQSRPSTAQRSAEISKLLKRTNDKQMRNKLIDEKLALKFGIK